MYQSLVGIVFLLFELLDIFNENLNFSINFEINASYCFKIIIELFIHIILNIKEYENDLFQIRYYCAVCSLTKWILVLRNVVFVFHHILF